MNIEDKLEELKTAKDIDAARESARNDIREALYSAALDAYNNYTAVNAEKALNAARNYKEKD